MRLNLGCGHKPLDGFWNLDFVRDDRSKPDAVHDLTKRLPFEDGSVDEVHSYHLIEHFDRWLVTDILADWARVLKPGGKVVVECPCLDKMIHVLAWHMEHQVEIPHRIFLGLYGDPKDRRPEMMHRWGYSVSELESLMEDAGFAVTVHEPQTHIKARDMRLEGIKRGSIDVR